LSKTVDIEVYGQRYTVKGEAEEEHVKRVAAFVDQQMRSLAQGMKTTTLAKLAVLTALNIADQFMKLDDERRQGEAELERRAAHLMESIEEQLQSTPRR
jgi:cell division protein ZapA